MDPSAPATPFDLDISPPDTVPLSPMPTGFAPHQTIPRDLPSYRDLDRLTLLSLSSGMVIKPESPPALARNSGHHEPSEAPPRRTIKKRNYMQVNAAFTELQDSIPSMRVAMAKEGEENTTQDPQKGTPKTKVDKVS